MAKQFIISAMEETLGEYILNISKENLKIAALRGQIKLENVQLDGDLVGSHVLGVVGLSSFGVLSCSAKSIKVAIPWKTLEKEPTRFEIKGIHLVCVPLTPSTANQMYGAGTLVDPRCTLRTRAKRLVLARFERNFWNGQISGEGPVMKRIQRAVKEVERDMKKSSSNKQRRRDKGYSAEEAAMDDLLDNLVLTLGGDASNESNTSIDASMEQDDASHASNVGDIPELPRDWKVRLREKILRNMEASFHDIHIRLEVPERGLEFSGMDASPDAAFPTRTKERAFAMGFTMESVVVRTANDKWEAGSHEKRIRGRLSSPSSTDHLGPNEYVAFNNKIGHFNKLSIYWDDDPPILLSETDALQGNYRKLTPEKLQTRVAAAMEALFSSQEPGTAIRQSLSAKSSRYASSHFSCGLYRIASTL
jgi:N-terminal region of Chorein or VPS13/Vacuolar sorting-associated protein 13, N-terminal